MRNSKSKHMVARQVRLYAELQDNFTGRRKGPQWCSKHDITWDLSRNADSPHLIPESGWGTMEA